MNGLITATVIPQVRNKLNDPKIRLQQYLEALGKIETKNIRKITIIENSGEDFETKARIVLNKKIDLEYIGYKENSIIQNQSFNELKMFGKYVRESKFIDLNSLIIKITGRYGIDNLDLICSSKSNLVYSFKPFLPKRFEEYVLSNIFIMECKDFVDFSKAVENEESKILPLERVLKNFVFTKNIKRINIEYPRIKAISGSKGIAYENIIQERARKFLSKILPSAYTW